MGDARQNFTYDGQQVPPELASKVIGKLVSRGLIEKIVIQVRPRVTAWRICPEGEFLLQRGELPPQPAPKVVRSDDSRVRHAS